MEGFKVKNKAFVKQVMQPATGKTPKSIVQRYDKRHQVRMNYENGELKGAQADKAISDYPDKLDVSVAKEKLQGLREAFWAAEAKKRGWAMDARSAKKPSDKRQLKVMELAAMRQKMAEERQQAEEKKMENIKKAQKRRIEEERALDMPID